jgi:predicted secreted protein
VNLTINADNLNGKTVYVQMWRNAVGTNGERVWDTQAVASGNSITFSDLLIFS